MERIAKVSRILRIVFLVIMLALPVITLVHWLFFSELLDHNIISKVHDVNLNAITIQRPITAEVKVLGFLVSLIPVSIDMIILMYLYKLFGLYVRGDIFTAKNVFFIRRLGYTILIGQALSPFIQCLMTLAMTFSNQPGQHMISLGLSDSNISQILIAFMIIIVAWIMDEGRKLQEEQTLVI